MSYNIDVRLRRPALLLSLFAVFTATTAHAHSEPWIPGKSPARVGAFTGVTPQNRIGGYQLASWLSGAELQLQPGGSTKANYLSITAHASGSGLFLQRDPAGFADSVNLYAGFAWDPVNNRDPTGTLVSENEEVQRAAARIRQRKIACNANCFNFDLEYLLSRDNGPRVVVVSKDELISKTGATVEGQFDPSRPNEFKILDVVAEKGGPRLERVLLHELHHWAEYMRRGRVAGDKKVRFAHWETYFADYVADVCRGISVERSPHSLLPSWPLAQPPGPSRRKQ